MKLEDMPDTARGKRLEALEIQKKINKLYQEAAELMEAAAEQDKKEKAEIWTKGM